jgi:CRP/FNR family transcriptional regulator
VLQLKKIEHLNINLPLRNSPEYPPLSRNRRCRNLSDSASLPSGPYNRSAAIGGVISNLPVFPEPASRALPQEIDPLYLFGCYIAWEQQEEPGAGWELISAAHSANANTRAHARALLSSSRHLGGVGSGGAVVSNTYKKRQTADEEETMKTPYALELTENCAQCTGQTPGTFCEFAPDLLQALDDVSHKMVLPSCAILFVEGQTPRGIFIVCSGRVNLSTTSREGKILILKSANVGQALGLSATVSDTAYETTAETATPCQITFIDRKHFLEFMQAHSEVGLHAAQCLSRDYQSAYHDIHDLILTRSSAGKLAKLLLSQGVNSGDDLENSRVTLLMTHEEMAQRIGASRETVTRLLTTLRRKRLIRLDGPRLVIRNRTALEALTV